MVPYERALNKLKNSCQGGVGTPFILCKSHNTNSELYYNATSTYLVKCWENVVCELNLGDGGGAGHGESDAEPSDALLAQRSVEHAVLAVFLL